MLNKLLFLIIIFSLSACGGGSGGDDNNSSNYRDARQAGSASSSADYIFTDYDNGSIFGSADYQNSDFIMMKVERAGKLQIEITPDDYSLDIDCGLTSSVGPSDEFYANNFIYDDNGFEIIENSYSSTCSLSADFSDDREFYLFIDIADGQVTSGSYTVIYSFIPEYIAYSYDAIGSDGQDGQDGQDGCHEGTTSNVELEPNDSVAQLVAFGQSIAGQISSVSDVDIYRLSAPGSGTITLSMSSDESPSSGWILELRDSDGFVLSSFTCDYSADCEEGITVPVCVSGAGDYMLVVSSESPYTKPDGLYTVSASFSG